MTDEFIIAGNGSHPAINHPITFLFSWLPRNQPFGSILVAVIITTSSKKSFIRFLSQIGKEYRLLNG